MDFPKLDDSPMFRQQLQILEENAESLRARCSKFYKGCRKYTEGLGEAYDGDIAFVNALDNFGGGQSDPICVAFGGPVMTKFTIALKEIGTYKEILKSQVQQMLNERLIHFVTVDVVDVKEARKRFDKASVIYDQAREKFLSLRKSSKLDVAAVLEEELHNARSSFEQARFTLVSALSNVEANKKYGFLEAVGGAMDAHLQFFKQGYELLNQMEPFIKHVLAYAQQSRESTNYELVSLNERMQEYRRQIDRENRNSFASSLGSPTGDGLRPFSRNSHKVIEAVMQSGVKGKVQTIRQGYLSKRSSNLRGDWKRRFFVLDSRGMLYYYRKPWNWPSTNGSQSQVYRSGSSENGPGLLSRWLSSHYHGGAHDEKPVARHTLNLLTSTIKMDADQSDLRFCFRIISPAKIYTLQAENAVDQMDWIDKITGVISSLLTFQSPERRPSASSGECCSGDSCSFLDSSKVNRSGIGGHTSENVSSGSRVPLSGNVQQQEHTKSQKPLDILTTISGNDKCADCGAPGPDWASLNLGVLICIECSGIHRNLGVHISKVRSLTLDVKVWEPSVLILFQSLGNIYSNSIWEELLLQSQNNCRTEEMSGNAPKLDGQKKLLAKKPGPYDPISLKELFIHAKYAEKIFVCKIKEDQHLLSVAQKVWESVRTNDKKAVYRHIVCSEPDLNAILGQALHGDALGSPSSCPNALAQSGDRLVEESLDGCSLLHLACLNADIGMVELLLQYGANVNAADSRQQTPLHHCIIRGHYAISRLLLTRGANPSEVDKEGKTPLQYASESDVNDPELVALLTNRR